MCAKFHACITKCTIKLLSIRTIADNIPTTDTQFSQYLSASTNVKNSLFLNQVTEVDILQLVAKVKPKKSKGHDELDVSH